MNKIFTAVLVCFSLFGLSSVAAQNVTDSSKAVPEKEGFSPAIEDNSFLIEEAYNQEERVVQHISTLMYTRKPDEAYFYTFTQEWPAGGQLHQLSYTIPYTYIKSTKANGIGDIMLNYRYQLLGHDDWMAAAPRLSFILPTGSTSKGLGSGNYGLQLNLPFSKRLSNYFVAHLNAGMTAGFVSYNGPEDKTIVRLKPSYFWGGSLIWLLSSNFNLMLEYLNNINGEFNYNYDLEFGQIEFSHVSIINPGLRFAININELQIVPGFCTPITISSEGSHMDVFFYLSFEHPF